MLRVTLIGLAAGVRPDDNAPEGRATGSPVTLPTMRRYRMVSPVALAGLPTGIGARYRLGELSPAFLAVPLGFTA